MGERGGSLGFQDDSEWEKGRWEGKVGGCEERGAAGMIFFSPSILSPCTLWWNTDEGMSLQLGMRSDRASDFIPPHDLAHAAP